MNMNNDALTIALQHLDAWQPTSPEAIATLEREAAEPGRRFTRFLMITGGLGVLVCVAVLILQLLGTLPGPMVTVFWNIVFIVLIPVTFLVLILYNTRATLRDARLYELKGLARHEQLEEIRDFFDHLPKHLQPHLQQVRAALVSADLSAHDAGEILVRIRAVKDAQYRTDMRASLAGEPATAGH